MIKIDTIYPISILKLVLFDSLQNSLIDNINELINIDIYNSSILLNIIKRKSIIQINNFYLTCLKNKTETIEQIWIQFCLYSKRQITNIIFEISFFIEDIDTLEKIQHFNYENTESYFSFTNLKELLYYININNFSAIIKSDYNLSDPILLEITRLNLNNEIMSQLLNRIIYSIIEKFINAKCEIINETKLNLRNIKYSQIKEINEKLIIIFNDESPSLLLELDSIIVNKLSSINS